jgi:parvulin-like peptidyl-prolyl isomerase
MQSSQKVAAVLTSVLLGAALITGCGQKPVAKVDGKDITADAYMAEMERIKLPTAPKSLGEMAMEKLIDDTVVLSEAEKQNVMPNDKDVQLELDATKFQNPQFDETIKQTGMTPTEYKENVKIQLAKLNLYTKGISVSKKDVDAEYHTAKKSAPYTMPPSVKWQVIVLPTSAEAEKIQKVLSEGANFSMVARDKSIDPQSKERGGEMPMIQLSPTMQGVPPELAKALRTLPEGKISDPIKVSGVYVLMKVTERTTDRLMPTAMSEWLVRKDLLLRKAAEKQKPIDEFISSLRDKSKVEIFRDRVKDAVKEVKPQ